MGETASSRTRGRPGRRPRGRRPRTVGPGERRSSRARKSGSSSAGRKPTSTRAARKPTSSSLSRAPERNFLVPQDAAEYVRLNVLLRGAQPQLSPQIIGRPDDVERLLDEAGERAQEVERGAAQAVEETAAVAAEEGEVDVAFGHLGGLQQPSHPQWARLASPGARAGCWRTRSSGLSRAVRTQAGRPARQRNERRHAASALHAARRQQHVRQPRKPRKHRLRDPERPSSGLLGCFRLGAGRVLQPGAPLSSSPASRRAWRSTTSPWHAPSQN